MHSEKTVEFQTPYHSKAHKLEIQQWLPYVRIRSSIFVKGFGKYSCKTISETRNLFTVFSSTFVNSFCCQLQWLYKYACYILCVIVRDFLGAICQSSHSCTTLMRTWGKKDAGIVNLKALMQTHTEHWLGMLSNWSQLLMDNRAKWPKDSKFTYKQWKILLYFFSYFCFCI